MGDHGFLDKSVAQDDLHIIRRYFALPVMAMVFITILNDGSIISTAYDYVEAGEVPEKCNLPGVCSIASLLGGVACGGSMLYMCLSTTELDSFLVKYFNVVKLTYRQVQCALCLMVSMTDFLTVFAARTHGFFFTRRPGVSLVALQFSQRALLISIMWAYCLVLFIIQNVVMVLAYAAVKHTEFSIPAGTKERSNQASEQPTMNVQEMLARINALEGKLQTLEKVTAEAK